MDIGIPTEMKNAEQVWKRTFPFKSTGHMDIKSEIAHVRFKTRFMEDKNFPDNNDVFQKNMKVLTVEEMQSDFAIAAMRRSKDYDAVPKIKDFPFKNTWYELVTKRLIRYAADNGFDAVAIPKGSLAATRYGQKIDKVKKIEFEINEHLKGKKYRSQGWDSSQIPKLTYEVRYLDDAGEIVLEESYDSNSIANIQKVIGQKEFSRVKNMLTDESRISAINNKTTGGDFVLDEVNVVTGSGKGKHELYDKAIPGFMKKYAKKWNAKVYDDTFDITDYRNVAEDEVVEKGLPVTIIKLTDEMKKAVQQDSQALFNIIGLTGFGGAVVSDSIKNNTISNNQKISK